jgi:hypothetical protein
MNRACFHCHRPFAPHDLRREDSRGMEAERKAAKIVGVRFLRYHCPACETDEIFVDILPLDGEVPSDFEKRRHDMEEAARQMHSDHVDVAVVPVERR